MSRHQPVPVSHFADEIVTRAYVTTRPLARPFGGEPVQAGSLIYARRSPFATAARSYWIEDYWGTLLAIVPEARLRTEFVRVQDLSRGREPGDDE